MKIVRFCGCLRLKPHQFFFFLAIIDIIFFTAAMASSVFSELNGILPPFSLIVSITNAVVILSTIGATLFYLSTERMKSFPVESYVVIRAVGSLLTVTWVATVVLENCLESSGGISKASTLTKVGFVLLIFAFAVFALLNLGWSATLLRVIEAEGLEDSADTEFAISGEPMKSPAASAHELFKR